MADKDKITCSTCEYTRQDIQSSEYAQKRCKKCDFREKCEICSGCNERDECKARLNHNAKQSCARRLDNICSKQVLKWSAIECGNKHSEYYKSLLNVGINGEMQNRITWSGCACGKRRCGI